MENNFPWPCGLLFLRAWVPPLDHYREWWGMHGRSEGGLDTPVNKVITVYDQT